MRVGGGEGYIGEGDGWYRPQCVGTKNLDKTTETELICHTPLVHRRHFQDLVWMVEREPHSEPEVSLRKMVRFVT